MAAIEPGLLTGLAPSSRGRVRALAGLGAVVLVGLALAGFFAAKIWPLFRQALDEAGRRQAQSQVTPVPPDPVKAAEEARVDLQALANVAEQEEEKNGAFPAGETALFAAWESTAGGVAEPVDPFDGGRYGYRREREGYVLWSSGPDGISETKDDIRLTSLGADGPSPH